jgi:hypothetical protein
MITQVLSRTVKTLALVIVLAGAFVVHAQSYDDLVAKARGGAANPDFKAMRIAFTGTKQFTSGVDPKLRAKLADSLKAKKLDEVAKTAQEILNTDFVNPNVHLIAARVYQSLKDEKKAQFHTNVFIGLVNSIINEGNGESTKTAYHVISEDEATAVLAALELRRTSETAVEEGGHKYSVVTAADATNATTKVYFNIDKVPPKAAQTTTRQ